MLPKHLSILIDQKDWKCKLQALKEINSSKLEAPETVLRLGTSLLTSNSWQLGQEYWEVCEAVFYASLDCQAGDWTKVLPK